MSKEREKEILKLLLAKKEISVNELSKKLFISESSIIRDLAKLESRIAALETKTAAVTAFTNSSGDLIVTF